MSSIHHGLLALALALLSVTSAHAIVCGDDVEGVRVACECGDIVVSDTRLRIDDPIVMRRCETDGLLVRAAADAESISLDLAGLSIQGSGAGTGIRILRGGRLGAQIIGDSDGAAGQVVGFYTGISARGKNTLASLANVQIESSTRTGVAVDTNAAVLSNVTTLGNGGDGARLGGRSINASSIEAHLNGGAGVAVSGRNQRVQGRAANNSESAVSDCRHSKSNSIEVSQ
jgi:hypothetical protein